MRGWGIAPLSSEPGRGTEVLGGRQLQEGAWGPEEEAAEQGGQQSGFWSRCRGAAGAPKPGHSVRTEAEDQR